MSPQAFTSAAMYSLSCAGVGRAVGEDLLYLGLRLRLHHFLVEAVHDLLRSFRRREQRSVEPHVVARHRLGDRRHFEEMRTALDEGGAEQHRLADLSMRQDA